MQVIMQTDGGLFDDPKQMQGRNKKIEMIPVCDDEEDTNQNTEMIRDLLGRDTYRAPY